jgi:hypothetical protein
MNHSNEDKYTISDWYKWIELIHQRANAAKKGEFYSRLKLNSKTLIFYNMKYIYGPMIVGVGKGNSKRRTLWFLDVTKDNPYELEWRDKTRTWAVMRMEFVESRLAENQTDNMGLYDGLSLSDHFIQRLFERNLIQSKTDFTSLIQSVMAGIVRLDTKNLAEDFLSLGCEDLGLVSELGIFFVGLKNYNSSGRMIIKTFISFEDMSNSKRSKFLKILSESSLYKQSSVNSRFAVISSRPEDGTYEAYDDFVKNYVTSDKYIPPKAVNSNVG